MQKEAEVMSTRISHREGIKTCLDSRIMGNISQVGTKSKAPSGKPLNIKD